MRTLRVFGPILGFVALIVFMMPINADAQTAPVATATVKPSGPPKFTMSKPSVAPGDTMLLTWTNLINPSGSDMAALFAVGAPYDEMISWVYMTTCAQSHRVPGIGWVASSCRVAVPDPMLPGAYEWRVLRTLGFQQLSEMYRWPAFTVTDPIKPNGKPYVASVAVKPTAAVGGDLVTVLWKEIADPTVGDWIGLFLNGEKGNQYPRVWARTSCDEEAPRGVETGACTLGLPFDLIPATYEVRLLTYADGLFRVLAVSDPIEIGSPPPDATPPAPKFTLRVTPTRTPVPAAP